EPVQENQRRVSTELQREFQYPEARRQHSPDPDGYRRGRGAALHQQRPVARSAATGAPDYQPATQPGDRTRRTLRCSTADATAGDAALTVLRTIPPAPAPAPYQQYGPRPRCPDRTGSAFGCVCEVRRRSTTSGPAEGLCPCHRLGASCHAQFGVDAPRMGLDRMQRDEQLFGDLLIRATL